MDLRFDGVGVRYAGGPPVLAEISFTVAPGSFCVILGASGAGKSTLLRTVNGLVAPSHGRVLVGGTAVDRKTKRGLRRRIGMIHQHFALVPRASVASNVMAGAAPELPLWRIMTGIWPVALQRRAMELLHATGLGQEHLGRRADRLSGGQQQRVGIARAFMLDPAIILADEPVASLDPEASRQVLTLLKQQARAAGATVLCSLHQLDLARAFADRIVALHDGGVVFDGPPHLLGSAQIDHIYARRSPDPAMLGQAA